MAKAVFLHKAGSIYDDVPELRYEFPDRYLYAVRETIGDWIVYYAPGRTAQRYFAVARVQDVVPSPKVPGRHHALIASQSFLEFDHKVPRTDGTHPFESALADRNGLLMKQGGRRTEAVRLLPDAEFARIVNLGLPVDLEEREARRYQLQEAGVSEGAGTFERPVVERLTRRPYRDVAFRRKVRSAYGNRCAMSGLELRNGGGRPEVQAAHIIPVEAGGDDTVRNGLALSGTLHWMFDRGLISVAADDAILVSHNKVPKDVSDRLFMADMRLIPPQNPQDRPHPEYLRWHRENRFGMGEFA